MDKNGRLSEQRVIKRLEVLQSSKRKQLWNSLRSMVGAGDKDEMKLNFLIEAAIGRNDLQTVLPLVAELSTRMEAKYYTVWSKKKSAARRIKREAGLVLGRYLYFACSQGCLPLVKLFLEYGANVNVTVKGISPLYVAVEQGSKAIVQALLEHEVYLSNAKVNRVTGFHAIHLACQFKSTQVLEVLLDYAPFLHLSMPTMPDKVSCLMIASSMGNDAMVRYLLRRQCNVLLEDKEGNTALHYACVGGHVEVVATLLSCGVLDPMKVNKLQKSPVDIANELNHKVMIELLMAGVFGPNSSDVVCIDHIDFSMQRIKWKRKIKYAPLAVLGSINEDERCEMP